MKPRICVALTAHTLKGAIGMAEVAEDSGADMLELRLDYLNSYGHLRDLVKSTKLPIILTLRKSGEGGKFQGSEEKRISTLLKAAGEGFSYVDVELSTSSLAKVLKELNKIGVKKIVSYHNLKSTPQQIELFQIARKEMSVGAGVCKIVTKANTINDNITCLNLVSRMQKRTKIICFATGKLGTASRIFSPLLGAYLTFASVTKGKESAPGQLTLKEMIQIYQLLGAL
jgi:3-dehydroquinate dehydratase type I